MIVRVLGILDIFSAICFFIFSKFNILPETLILVVAFYLLVKGAAFLIFRDVLSMIDILCSFVIFAALNMHVSTIVSSLVVLFLLGKGVFSLLR